jgi:hypothetical protein
MANEREDASFIVMIGRTTSWCWLCLEMGLDRIGLDGKGIHLLRTLIFPLFLCSYFVFLLSLRHCHCSFMTSLINM